MRISPWFHEGVVIRKKEVIQFVRKSQLLGFHRFNGNFEESYKLLCLHI